MTTTTIVILLVIGLLFGAAAAFLFYLAFRPRDGQKIAENPEPESREDVLAAQEIYSEPASTETAEEDDDAWDIAEWVPSGENPTAPVAETVAQPLYEKADDDLQDLLDRLEEYNASFPEREIFRDAQKTDDGQISPSEIRRLIWKLEQENPGGEKGKPPDS